MIEGVQPKIYENKSTTAASWILNGEYYIANVANASITANDVVNVNFHLASMEYVDDAEVLSVTESYDGGFRMYAKKQPTRMISYDYVVVKGKVIA
jgi:hypothetical protein